MAHHAYPALLTKPNYFGTLAAARDLGKREIKVFTVGSGKGKPTSLSKYVSEHYSCSSENNPDALIEWLLRYGEQHPNTVLYPTCDDTAWLHSIHAAALARHFCMYSPGADAIKNVLDKRRLFDACLQVGIDVPNTHFAEAEADVLQVAQQANFPLLLKQRTQVFSATRTKGALIVDPDKLADAYREFMKRNPHEPNVLKHMPYASWPLLQDYYADTGNYLVAGFVNRDHTEIVALASVKLLQYPRSLGIALCLERSPLKEETVEKLLALCKQTGYYGVFQVEYLVSNGRMMLNDFNPRFYHYMEFDIARGLPLPWLAYLGSIGEEKHLAQEIAHARANLDRDGHDTFTCRSKLFEMIWAQRLTGTMTHRDFKSWQQWYRHNKSNMVFALADAEDNQPEVGAVMDTILEHLRHPRAFIRKIALDRILF